MSGFEAEGPIVSPITWKYVLIRGFVDVFGQLKPFGNYKISVERTDCVAIRDKENGIKGWLEKTDALIFSKLHVEEINIMLKPVSSPKLGEQKVSVLLCVQDERKVSAIKEIFEQSTYKFTVHKENPWN